MAAGKVVVPVNTQTAVVSNTEQWSSDGTTGGNIQPFIVLSDTAQSAYFTNANPGFVTATIAAGAAAIGTVTANAGTNLNTSLLALETGGNLATIVTNTGHIPSQGQALAAASLPVVLTAAQVTTLTPLTTVTVTQATGSNLHTVIDSGTLTTVTTVGTVTSVTAIANALPAGTNLLGKVSIDQTTPGTTNAVSATNLPTTVDVNSGNKSNSTLRVVLATDQPQLTNKLLVTPDANSAINLAQVGGSSTAVGHGTAATALRVELPTDGTGTLATVSTVTAVTAITNALPAGTNLLGKVGIDQTTVGTTNGVSIVSSTVGGCSTFHLVVASGTNASVIKASAGTLKSVQVYNNSANIAYLKFYNSTSNPTPGSGTIIKVVMIPASTSGAGATMTFPGEGIAFSTGIAFVVTGGIADNDSTSVAASAFLVEVDYK